jgi:hypothetical protein
MATPSIGGYQFIEFQGELPIPRRMTVDEITRPNIDGHAFVQVGQRANKVSIRTTVDTADPTSLANSHSSLQASLVTVVCPDGTSLSNVLVERYRKLDAKFCVSVVGGLAGGSWILTSEWTLQPTN